MIKLLKLFIICKGLPYANCVCVICMYTVSLLLIISGWPDDSATGLLKYVFGAVLIAISMVITIIYWDKMLKPIREYFTEKYNIAQKELKDK